MAHLESTRQPVWRYSQRVSRKPAACLVVPTACLVVPTAFLKGSSTVFERYPQLIWRVPAACLESTHSAFGGCPSVSGGQLQRVWRIPAACLRRVPATRCARKKFLECSRRVSGVSVAFPGDHREGSLGNNKNWGGLRGKSPPNRNRELVLYKVMRTAFSDYQEKRGQGPFLLNSSMCQSLNQRLPVIYKNSIYYYVGQGRHCGSFGNSLEVLADASSSLCEV